VWIMVPAGEATDEVIDGLASRLAPRDTLIDGGNSNFRDTIRRSERLSGRGIDFLDVGTSGGTWGLNEGYCLMIGGDPGVVERHRPFFESLAPSPDTGWGHVGPVGAGHFAKMVHNGIEYALMQAYAEGFDLLAGNSEFSLDLHRIAEIWRHGSVIRSWLLDLTASILERNPALDGIAPRVENSGEGRWMVAEAIDAGVPVPVIALALFLRFQTRQDAGGAAKLVAALRKEFGGHDVQST